MSEVEISILVLPLAIMYICCFIFNFGATMAYLTRYDAVLKWNIPSILNVYVASFVVGMFSFFAMPANFLVVEFPNHGWKLWHGEIRRSRNKWFERIEQERKRIELTSRHRMSKNSKADGLCNSIWE